MIKEMYVSSTPHETKVAITEDDQLAEIFFERENEYTLAGSIYKGRVTRVLPGMQSAFVDIGLERDAFLYVSDFLDLGELDEDDLEDVPVRAETYVTNKPVAQNRDAAEFLRAVQDPNASLVETTAEVDEDTEEDFSENGVELNAEAGAQPSRQSGEERDAFRFNRGRRRRGRRGRPFGDERPPRHFDAAQNVEAAGDDISPEHSPITLPGESLSKYRRNQQPQERTPVEPPVESLEEERDEIPYAAAPPRPSRRPLPPTEAMSIGGGALLPGETRRRLTPREQVAPSVQDEPVTEPTLEASEAAELPGERVEESAAQPSAAALSNELNPEIVSTMPAMVPPSAPPAPRPAATEPVLTLPGESLRKYRRAEPVQEVEAEVSAPVAAEDVSPVEEVAAPEISRAVEESSDYAKGSDAAPESVGVAPLDTPADAPVAGPMPEAAPSAEAVPAEAAPSVEEEPTEGSARVSGPAKVAPLVLPGETLRKYSRRKKAQPAPVAEEPIQDVVAEAPAAPAETMAAAELLDMPPVQEEATPAAIEAGNPEQNLANDLPAPAAETVAAAEEAPAADAPSATVAETEFVNEQSADAEAQLAEARPHVPADEQIVASEVIGAEPSTAEAEMERRPSADFEGGSEGEAEQEDSITERIAHPAFEPSAERTMSHEELETDELPDDEHEFRQVTEIGAYEDVGYEDEFEEQTLLDPGSEAEPDEEEVAAAGSAFVIEGGFDVHGADLDEEDEEEEEEDEEFAGQQASGAPAPNRDFQRRPFDRRRGRRGGRRPPVGRPPRRDAQRQSIQIGDLLKEGQEVLIQIAKEPIGKKGARITSHIALPGRYLVYMPTVNHIGVSRKIGSDEERQRLKRIMISEREGGHGGFIVRTAAAGIGEDELRADIRFLKNLWQEIRTRSENAKSPALIYHDLNLVERVLRDQVTSDFSTIWVDTESEYERILRFANRFQPSLVRKVKLYTKATPLYEQFGIQEEINKALKAKVWLKSGGYIVINQTEALVAIDINTGKYVGKTQRLEDTIVKTNIDAIREIVRQIRLRDLGGIIVIDFIDMDDRKNRQKVMQELELAMRADRSPSKILAFNDFGLVAITRKRVKQSLERTLGTPCTYCTGTGYTKAVNTMCNEIYIEMRKLTRQLEKDDVLLRVNPEVAKALKSGRWITEMEELTRRNIIVKSDPMLHIEQFDFN